MGFPMHDLYGIQFCLKEYRFVKQNN